MSCIARLLTCSVFFERTLHLSKAIVHCRYSGLLSTERYVRILHRPATDLSRCIFIHSHTVGKCLEKHHTTYLTPYSVQATEVALCNYMQTFMRLSFPIHMHAICIRVTRKTKFSYAKLYKTITAKQREMSPLFIDKMADKIGDSSCSLWYRQKLGSAHRNRSLGFTVHQQNTFFLWKLSLLYSLQWCFFAA